MISTSPNENDAGATTPGLARERGRALALSAGFMEAGVVELPYAAAGRDAARFEEWIGTGRAGSMRYLERVDERGRLVRSEVRIPFPWARSAIVCFAGYHSAQARSTDAARQGTGWIARYAWSSRLDANGVRRASDYHRVLKKRLLALEAAMHEEYGEFEARAYVDTGPVVERSLATAAGLGWTGRNTCLIHPKLGSYGFLGVLLTSLAVREGGATLAVPDRCGSCRRCLDACPTGALIAPYKMDATRCISYLTIEHRGAVDEALMAGVGRQVFGCDICQDVCPWNRKAPVSADAELEALAELVNPPLEWLAGMDEARFEQVFNGSPVRRTGFSGLRRNVAIAMGNSGRAEYAARLRQWTVAADAGLRMAAEWALRRLKSGPADGDDEKTG